MTLKKNVHKKDPMAERSMNIDSLRMVYVYFHRPIYHRDFSMTVLLKIIYGQDIYSLMYV